MHERSEIEFAFSEPTETAKSRLITCETFSAEHVQIGVRTPYEFARRGSQLYVALHDIKKLDGETYLDGSSPSVATDIRNKLTLAPPDCSLSGWALPARSINFLTALHIKPELLTEELNACYREKYLPPMLYFEDENLRSSLTKMRRLLCSESAPDRLYLETLGLLVVMELGKILGNGSASEATASGHLSKRQIGLVLDFIQSNLNQQISLSDLATLAGQSRFHFCRAFKKAVGTTPVRHLRALRIEAARNLLRSRTMTIAEVAEAVGFRGTTQFCRVFFAIVGMSPSEYRRSF